MKIIFNKTILLVLFLVPYIACKGNEELSKSSTGSNISLSQKGEVLPIDNVPISWSSREENPRPINNMKTYFRGMEGDLYAYEAYYADNIKETRRFYFPDNVTRARFYFGPHVHMRAGDKLIFREGVSLTNPGPTVNIMDGYYGGYIDPNSPEGRVYQWSGQFLKGDAI